MKKFKQFGFIFVFLVTSAAYTASWSIDRDIKFQIAYLPATKTVEVTDEWATALKTFTKYVPDITNIPYSNIIQMGFPLPKIESAENFKFYLKVLKWPQNINASISSKKH